MEEGQSMAEGTISKISADQVEGMDDTIFEDDASTAISGTEIG